MFSPQCMITCCSNKSMLVLSLRIRPYKDIVVTNVSSSCSPPKQEWTVLDWLCLCSCLPVTSCSSSYPYITFDPFIPLLLWCPYLCLGYLFSIFSNHGERNYISDLRKPNLSRKGLTSWQGN